MKNERAPRSRFGSKLLFGESSVGVVEAVDGVMNEIVAVGVFMGVAESSQDPAPLKPENYIKQYIVWLRNLPATASPAVARNTHNRCSAALHTQHIVSAAPLPHCTHCLQSRCPSTHTVVLHSPQSITHSAAYQQTQTVWCSSQLAKKAP